MCVCVCLYVHVYMHVRVIHLIDSSGNSCLGKITTKPTFYGFGCFGTESNWWTAPLKILNGCVSKLQEYIVVSKNIDNTLSLF